MMMSNLALKDWRRKIFISSSKGYLLKPFTLYFYFTPVYKKQIACKMWEKWPLILMSADQILWSKVILTMKWHIPSTSTQFQFHQIKSNFVLDSKTATCYYSAVAITYANRPTCTSKKPNFDLTRKNPINIP